MSKENYLIVRRFLTRQITQINSKLTSDAKNKISKLSIMEREKLASKLIELRKSRDDLVVAHDKKNVLTLELQAEKTVSQIASAVSKTVKKEDINLVSLDDLKYSKPIKKKGLGNTTNRDPITSEII